MTKTMERLGGWQDLLRWGDRFPRLFDDGFFDSAPIRVEEYTEDDGKTLVVRAEMPGIDPDKDVEITVEHGVMRLRAERRESKKEEKDNGYRSEFHYGSFSRAVALPSGATEDDVKATYTDGILEVRIPVNGETEVAKIPVARA